MSAEPWTTRRLLAWMSDEFARRELDSPKLSAEILLSRALGCERLKLYMDADRPASAEELRGLRGLVKRALAHEPVQYLTGESWFYGLKMDVDSRVLIPRPETETLVDLALEHLKSLGDRAPVALDLCCGSGAIACALASHAAHVRVVASDISAGALEVARTNASRLGVSERIDFLEGDLFEPLGESRRFDLLCANPPYISDVEWEDVAANVREHEPALALRGGDDGFEIIRRLLCGCGRVLADGGLLLCEIGASQADVAAALAAEHGLRDIGVVNDLAGRPRVLRGVWALDG